MDKHVFLGANTADGLVQFYDRIIEMWDLRKLYILKGTSGGGKSTFIKTFGAAFEGHRLVWLYCSGDPGSLDGVIIEDLQTAVIDGTHPHPADPKYPGIIDEIINLGAFLIPGRVRATKTQIDAINARKRRLYARAFRNLADARAVHMKLEGLYAGAMDFDSVNALCSKVITDTKLAAGAIRRKSDFENSTK